MHHAEEIRTKLREFIAQDKFETYGHLQEAVENSTTEDKQFINDEMNRCAAEILTLLETGATDEKKIHEIVKQSIDRVEAGVSDTEDREFCSELYFKIGEITGIDLEDYADAIQQHMMGSLQRLLAKAGLNLDDFLKNNPGWQ